MKKIISFSISVIGIVAVFGVIAWFSSKSLNKANSEPNHNLSTSLSAKETNYDFGTVSMAAGKVAHSFEFTNTSSQPVLITSVSTSCMCTEATLFYKQDKIGPFAMVGMGKNDANEKISPGDSASIEVIFDPAAHGPAGVGTISRVVTVETDAGMLTFDFSANVTP